MKKEKEFNFNLNKILQNTSNVIFGKFIKKGGSKIFITEEIIESIKLSLLNADILSSAVNKIFHSITQKFLHKRVNISEVKQEIFLIIEKIISPYIYPIKVNEDDDFRVIMLCGLNGAGKTTTVGKMSYILNKHNISTAIAICDTTRKAATDQLKLFTNQLDLTVIAQEHKEEKPTSIVKRALEVAKKEGKKILLIDTPGYHPEHTEYIKDIRMIRDKIEEFSPNSTKNFIVAIDSSSGQNAISTIKSFASILSINGMVITKIDITQKVGMIISACNELKIPMHGIGIGLGVEDMKDFSVQEFIKGLSIEI